jgi:hypothetical protein
MRRSSVLLLSTVVALFTVCRSVEAVPIAEFTTGVNSGTFFVGQSVTTPGTGPWNELTFNWFDPNGAAVAGGTLFVYDQAFAGTPAALSAAAPGFIGQSATIVAGVWHFDPSVILQANTLYFFYSNVALSVSGSGGPATAYPGGSAFFSNGVEAFFTDLDDDANFRLTGTPVPEPASGLLLLTGLAAARLARRRRTRQQ